MFRRFDENFAEMKRAMKSNAVGDVHYMRVTSRDSPKPSYEFLASAGIVQYTINQCFIPYFVDCIEIFERKIKWIILKIESRLSTV